MADNNNNMNNNNEHADDNGDGRSLPRRRGQRQRQPPPGQQQRAAAAAAGQQQQQQQLPEHVRDRQRAVAEREAARLARPDTVAAARVLGHADRTKSAVTSTPTGGAISFLSSSSSTTTMAAVTTTATSATTTTQQQEESSWCGPFSVARQLIASREAAKRQRQQEELEEEAYHPLDQAVAAMEREQIRRAHPSMQWKPTMRQQQSDQQWSVYAKRQKRAERLQAAHAIPSLLQACVAFLVDHFEHVESLGDAVTVDDTIRTAITTALIDQGKFNETSFRAVYQEPGIEIMDIIDCSSITESVLREILQTLLPTGLKCIVLDQVGRCFGSTVVAAIVESCEEKKTSEIMTLSLGGAYLLTDEQASQLIAAVAKSITSLEFKACPLLGKHFCQAIPTFLAPHHHQNLLELALEDIPLTTDMLLTLSSQPVALQSLRNLRLCRLEGLTDEAVARLLAVAGHSLEGLELRTNYHLTDDTLGAIRRYCCTTTTTTSSSNTGDDNKKDHSRLQSLTLVGLRHITATGLEALFTVVPEMANPPRLRHLDLSQGDHEAVTDEVIDKATQAANCNRVAGDGLVYLNVQGSCSVSDHALEHLATRCAASLQELNVSFCRSITSNGLGYLVDTVGLQLSKVSVWGNAQLADDFLDGHRRAHDSTLEICGAWIKKFNSSVA